MLPCRVFASLQPAASPSSPSGYPLCFDNDPYCLSLNPFLLITIWIAYIRRALPASAPLTPLFATLTKTHKASPNFSQTGTAPCPGPNLSLLTASVHSTTLVPRIDAAFRLC